MEFYKSTHLLTGSEDHTVCIWRVHDWALLHVLGGHKAAVTSLRCVWVTEWCIVVTAYHSSAGAFGCEQQKHLSGVTYRSLG